jgi:hypothetical protein
LGAAFAVPDINKDQPAEIAPGMDPAGQGDNLPDMFRAQFVAMVRAFHVKNKECRNADCKSDIQNGSRLCGKNRQNSKTK